MTRFERNRLQDETRDRHIANRFASLQITMSFESLRVALSNMGLCPLKDTKVLDGCEYKLLQSIVFFQNGYTSDSLSSDSAAAAAKRSPDALYVE
jgi:hypothetical protein